MFGIAIVILIVSVLIVGHELGHFLVARLFGLQTPVFGLGLPYGPSWVIAQKWDTQLRIHLLLFGAYDERIPPYESLDAIVEDYMRLLRRALEGLPAPLASQIIEEVSGR